jgi:hypothetical protein
MPIFVNRNGHFKKKNDIQIRSFRRVQSMKVNRDSYFKKS